MYLKKVIFTNSRNYTYNIANNITAVPVGIVVHSSGCDNPNLWRYVQPNDGEIGVNPYGTHWNKPGIELGMHAFIGKLKSGEVATVQTLPFNMPAWGCGRGENGSFNYSPTMHIQFEICEDGLNCEEYFNTAFREAAEFCAYLCREFGLPVSSIVSHKEAGVAGYASKHGDPENWMVIYGKTMDDFRAGVDKILKTDNTDYKEKYETLMQSLLEVYNRYSEEVSTNGTA